MKDSTQSSTPRAGDVLIAHPKMTGNLFSETLIFLHTHEAEGSLGLILNRPSGQQLSTMMNDPLLPEPFHQIPLHYGGPVQDHHFLLTLFKSNSETHSFSCELNPDRDRLVEMSSQPNVHLKAFLGYAGWSAGQLEDEIRREDWYWSSADEIMLTSKPNQGLWKLAIQGDTRWKKIRGYLPTHPEWN